MLKTEKTVILLKTIATVAGFAIILWSLGLPSLRFADAANITDVSDTLSDSAPGVVSNHTITFVTPTGVANGATTTITFPAGFTGIAALGVEDVDFASTTDMSIAANCGASDRVRFIASGQTVSFVFCPGDGGVLTAGATTTIQIGTNATFGSPGNSQITNPVTEGSYEIGFIVGASDSGWTRVVILSDVLVTAAVDTIFTFAVAGLGAGQSVNGTTTTGVTSSTSIPFGTLTSGVATRTAQRLTVNTNASNGDVVTVQLDQPRQSSTGADIDGFSQGSYTNIPVAWAVPTSIVGSENTYGHWGITSDDATTTRDAGDEFNVNEWASASTSPRVVMSHTGPANGTGMGQGTTTVGYKVQIGGLQEAGDDYTATLTYVATPTF
jgi:hypothetical protein